MHETTKMLIDYLRIALHLNTHRGLPLPLSPYSVCVGCEYFLFSSSNSFIDTNPRASKRPEA